ncbi:unnamed protein product [Haemonchus placei]|uniref:Secreted protein n=1 Tax=Haemonchus placei TaxID=6290 RepID=A0A0N4VUN5_HAEPC|nr:unnamed protein product [Haemonchus placei]
MVEYLSEGPIFLLSHFVIIQATFCYRNRHTSMVLSKDFHQITFPIFIREIEVHFFNTWPDYRYRSQLFDRWQYHRCGAEA